MMAAVGMSQDQIALSLDTTAKTIRKHFRRELAIGAIEANTRVLETLFRMAKSGKNTPASIFWAKVRCGYRERPVEDKTEQKPEGPPTIVVRQNEGKTE